MTVKIAHPFEAARPEFKSHLHYLLALCPRANLPLWSQVWLLKWRCLKHLIFRTLGGLIYMCKLRDLNMVPNKYSLINQIISKVMTVTFIKNCFKFFSGYNMRQGLKYRYFSLFTSIFERVSWKLKHL